MISWKYKLWRNASAAALVAACSQPAEAPPAAETHAAAPASGGEAGEAAIGEAGGEHGEAGVATAYAGLEGEARAALRLQHLKGFVLVAQQVGARGSADEATMLVQQGLLEVYEPAHDQFAALDVGPVRSAADDIGNAAAALAALNTAQSRLDANQADVTARMLEIATGLYQHVVQDGFVDPIEYQHSLGAALAARDALATGRASLRGRDAVAYDEAQAELDRFVALWPAPSAPETPAAYPDVLRQASRVRLALSPFL